MQKSNLAPLSDREARLLLRRLRDLNLLGTEVALGPGSRVRIGGCSSTDSPVEGGVRYRLVGMDDSERCLELVWSGGQFHMSLNPEGSTAQVQVLDALVDPMGRATLPEAKARTPLATCERRDLEHFLRRLVRHAAAPHSA